MFVFVVVVVVFIGFGMKTMLQGCLLSVKFHQLGKGVNGRDRPKRWRLNRLPSLESGLLLKRDQQ